MLNLNHDSQNIHDVLYNIFGYQSFRGLQEEIIQNTIDGKDALVLMPTGGGKSLCYQIPSIVLPGMAVVISPLISLMHNQVNALKLNGVQAELLNSSLDQDSWRTVVDKVKKQSVQILYLSPEGINRSFIKNILQKSTLSLIAVDEAHCVSQWGHEFRQDYQELKWIKKTFPTTPLLALTATADQRVRKDILSGLQISGAKEFLTSFDRPNITYHMQPKAQSFDQLTKLITKHHPNECGIIYCQTRNKVEQTATKLKSMGFNALAYHAGMPDQQREKAQKEFEDRDDIIIVATIAFGMGIDKPNVRFVAHLDMPKNIESYYQETGRAGRDGHSSSAWMFYGVEDVIRNKHFLDQSQAKGAYKKVAEEKIDQMLNLCELTTCRRRFLLQYFHEDLSEDCGNCDICLKLVELEDLTQEAKMFLSCVYHTKIPFGVNYYIDILKGKENVNISSREHDHLSVYSIGKHLSESRWRDIARNLIFKKYLLYESIEYKTLKLSPLAGPLLKGEEKFLVHKKISKKKNSSKKSQSSMPPTSSHPDLMAHLKDLRLEIAEELGVPAFYVFSNKTLEDMTLLKPQNKDQFLLVHGVGQKKCDLYSDLFINAIKSYHQSQVV